MLHRVPHWVHTGKGFCKYSKVCMLAFDWNIQIKHGNFVYYSNDRNFIWTQTRCQTPVQTSVTTGRRFLKFIQAIKYSNDGRGRGELDPLFSCFWTKWMQEEIETWNIGNRFSASLIIPKFIGEHYTPYLHCDLLCHSTSCPPSKVIVHISKRLKGAVIIYWWGGPLFGFLLFFIYIRLEEGHAFLDLHSREGYTFLNISIIVLL